MLAAKGRASLPNSQVTRQRLNLWNCMSSSGRFRGVRGQVISKGKFRRLKRQENMGVALVGCFPRYFAPLHNAKDKSEFKLPPHTMTSTARESLFPCSIYTRESVDGISNHKRS